MVVSKIFGHVTGYQENSENYMAQKLKYIYIVFCSISVSLAFHWMAENLLSQLLE